tara:strand:- start:384 stop:602 length:219 start_codon:yes stop_codon:yes gene_type:complete
LARVLAELKAVRILKRVVDQVVDQAATKWADYTVAVAAVAQVFFLLLGAMAVRGLLESYSDPEELFLVQTQI